MASIPILKTMVREIFTTVPIDRTPEPDLVMDDPDKVAAYTRAGREDGVMAPVYLFHAAQICDVIRPGETVVDLACGPATQLGLVARLNPDVNFIGVDLSDPMLERASAHLAEQGLKNVKTVRGTIDELSMFEDRSVDAVMSTMALHHLPDKESFLKTFSAIKRVLRPGGGIYLADFSRLKSLKSINYFAYQYADRQPELFTLDYLYSLKAAFSLDDFRQATDLLAGEAKLYSMFLMPFMVAVKSAARRPELPLSLRHELRRIREELPEHHKVDIGDLIQTFGLGGLKTNALKTK